MDFLKVFKDKKVIVTGHTGFKGTWLTLWLQMLEAEVVGISLDPKNENDLFNKVDISNKINEYRLDIRDKHKVIEIIEREKPDFIFHLAAQALVIDSYKDPVYTYEVNVQGTANVLEGIRLSEKFICSVFITTDKVYENKEWFWPYRENDRLGGYDPYSSSKAAAELIINSYRNSFFNPTDFKKHMKSIASVRAGNVIGGGDWSDNRLVPDFMRAIFNNENIYIRNPHAVRPWQHVLEPLGGYLLLASNMHNNPTFYCESFNFGPEPDSIRTVKDIVEGLVSLSGNVNWVDNSNKEKMHEAHLLSLDISKAKKMLKWNPLFNFEETLKYTYEGYVEVYKNNDRGYCVQQINKYMELWNLKGER